MQARADKSDAALSRICVLQRELDFDENSLEAPEFLALAHRMGHIQMTKAQARFCLSSPSSCKYILLLCL
jgi:hypothetical protein